MVSTRGSTSKDMPGGGGAEDCISTKDATINTKARISFVFFIAINFEVKMMLWYAMIKPQKIDAAGKGPERGARSTEIS